MRPSCQGHARAAARSQTALLRIRNFQLGSGELQTQTGKVRGIGRRIQQIRKNRAGRQLRRLRPVQAISLRGKGVIGEQVLDGRSRKRAIWVPIEQQTAPLGQLTNSATTYGNLKAQTGVVCPQRVLISPFGDTRIESGVRFRPGDAEIGEVDRM